MIAEKLSGLYRTKYDDFLVSLAQTAALTAVSGAVLRDFPSELPPPMPSNYARIKERFEDRFNKQEVTFPKELLVGFHDPDPVTVALVTYCLILKAAEREPNFENAVMSQGLVMIFAHLDAFIADSVGVICRAQPNVMKSGSREISWEQIVDCGNWERLLEHMIDKYVYSFGKGSIADRIARLEDRFGFDLDIEESALDLLEQSEYLRHAFVHAGGRADRNFIDSAGSPEMPIGTLLVVDQGYVDAVEGVARNLGSVIYGNICSKFLGMADEDIIIHTTNVTMADSEEMTQPPCSSVSASSTEAEL